MTSLFRILATLALCLLPFLTFAGDATVDFTDDDPKMSRAIAHARDTLPVFLSKTLNARGHGASNATLKVIIPRTIGAGHEVIWVNTIRKVSEHSFTGKLGNNPNFLKGLHLGSKVSFHHDQIADWGLEDSRTGKLFGHYTTRVVISGLPADQRRQYQSMLAKRPLPAGW